MNPNPPKPKPNHPWRDNYFNKKAKLKAVRIIARNRRQLKYRNENIEERRQMERNYHRKRLGIPLDAPLLKPGRKKTVKTNEPTP